MPSFPPHSGSWRSAASSVGLSTGGVPVRVEYSLTEKGATVVPVLQMVCRWSKQTRIVDENRILVRCRRRDYIKI